MTSIGFDKSLYILPFDHPGWSYERIFGWKGELTEEHAAQITDSKRMIYDSFQSAITLGVPKNKAGILVDEQFGGAILQHAAELGVSTCCPVEKTGQDEFDFEFGEDFSKHIEAVHPTFCKVAVRYNAEGDHALNARQEERLRRLSDYVHKASRSFFMLELLVPPLKVQLDRFHGAETGYESQLRPQLTIQAIEQLQDAGVEPDVWNVEGFDRREDYERIAGAARRKGRDKVGCLVVCRGEDDLKGRVWLRTAASVLGFVGFVAGRTSLWSAMMAWQYANLTREETVALIARRYREFVDSFEERRCAAA